MTHRTFRQGRRAWNSVRVAFDAGLLLIATLSDRLGIEEPVNESVWLGDRTPGVAGSQGALAGAPPA